MTDRVMRLVAIAIGAVVFSSAFLVQVDRPRPAVRDEESLEVVRIALSRVYRRTGRLDAALSVLGLLAVLAILAAVAFCGSTCHTVMEPEKVAHRDSPHFQTYGGAFSIMMLPSACRSSKRWNANACSC